MREFTGRPRPVEQALQKAKVREYKRPVFRRAEGLGFVLAAIHKGSDVACRQCSSCHGCR
jgi:hypothetical protein